MKHTLKLFSLILALAMLLSACAPATTPTAAPAQPTATTATAAQPTAAIPNPAAKYCVDQGNQSEIRTGADGSQSAVCKFPNGTECDEWSYFRRECSPAQAIQVTEADQGKKFTLNMGDSLVIVLDSNPSTGYAWVVKSVDEPVLSLAGEPVFKVDSGKLGAPGKTTLTFKTMSSGFQELTLFYQRSFEKDAQPLKTFTINVTVSSQA
jgi:inhibitor of cysteine peptidase